MQIDIQNPVQETLIFSIIFLTILFLTFKKSTKTTLFDISQTNELKGFAMLAIIFSHIGYFLSKENQFLFPLSILAGVGVNLFLFLSGFGLTLSALRKPLSVMQFYKKRLVRLFIPMWIVLVIYLLMDFFLLQRTHPMMETIQNFFGFFPTSYLFFGVNSTFWYFSWIFFFYLIFPILFNRKYPFFSSLAILVVAYLFLQLKMPINDDVWKLYKLHLFAFPLGVLFATLLSEEHGYIFHNLRDFLSLKLHFFKPLKPVIKVVLEILVVLIFAYTAYYSGVGKEINVEQTTSLITVTSITLIFLFKKITFRLFEFFGIYSYEIYLIHWPLLSRFDIIYKNFQPFVATLLYLAIFLGLGFLLKILVDKINDYLV